MGFTQSEYRGNELLIPSSILGFRQWYWLHDEKIPGSMYGDREAWSNGYLRASCRRFKSLTTGIEYDEHSSPEQDCSCGIYAHYLPLESYERIHGNNIFGVVEASGRILMGTKGFRAEKAKIVALAGQGPCNRWFENTTKLRGKYPEDVVDFCTKIGVPYFPTVRQMIYEFPQEDLTSLGVPDLDSWRQTRDNDKKQFELREKEARERLLAQQMQEEILMRRYGVSPSSRVRETFNFLGGFG